MIDDPQQAASRRNGNTAESIDALTLVSSAEVGRDISRPADRPPERRGALGRWPRRLRLAPRDAVADGLALCVLTVGVLVSFRESLAAGLVAFQKDTQIFYYPLQLWFAEEFKAGRFPLWNPYIFAGYPIFADGEVGLAYPLHLALLRLLPVAQAFIWLRISSVLVAALGMYALCRALRLGRVPATLGALTFSLGSFFLSQQHHEDVTRTAAWLPLVLACTEWGLHRAGWRRHLFFTAAAGALAMSALGLHPQVLAMSLLGFATFVIFRVLAGPSPYHLAARLALTIWIGGYVGGIGLGLACVQLLPLAEIGAATYRGSAPDYFFATSYALPMQNLVNLVFPYFFRGPDSEYWSLWAKWETALYVGLVPLLLGLMGMMLARRREVIYFAGLSVLALWLAFAAYAPYDLYEVLWSIPGFSSFRVPGRYVYLFVLAWSVLAAFGLQALARDAGEATGSRGKELWLRAFPPAVRNLFPVLLLAIGALAGVWLMGNLRASLTADEAGSLDWIRTSYLSLRHHAEGIEPIAAYDGLVYSLDPATPRTAFGLIMLAVALALAAGLALANRHRAWLWQGALVGAAAIDLVLFGVGFHQKLPVGQLSQGTPAIQFLQCEVRSADCGAEFGPESVVGGPPSAVQEWRVFTSGTSPSLESNRLVPFRVQDIGGYSSLESRRNYTYWTTIAGVQNQLLDMANVRYLVYPVRGPALPSYRLVPFDPERPLMMGGRDTLGGFESFTVGGERADRLQIVAALTRALDVPQGETVAEITVVPREGSSAVIPLRAGIDTAEWAYDRPDVAGKTKHQKPPEIAFRRPDVFLADGTQYSLFLYYTERDLPRPMEVERIEVRYVNPAGSIELYGIGLYSFDTGLTAPVTSQMRTKLRLVYQDDEVRIFENAATFPRGYVVPEARMAPSGVTALSAMQDTAFDPTREVMLEGLEAAGWPLEVPEPRENRGGLAEVGSLGNGVRFPIPRPEPLDIGTDRLTYRVAAPEGGYFVHVAHFFPGWRAWIDGVEAPILLANSLFRAVPLPPGEHVVELRYEPTAVVLGLQISLWTAAVALATLSGAFLARGLERRHRDP